MGPPAGPPGPNPGPLAAPPGRPPRDRSWTGPFTSLLLFNTYIKTLCTGDGYFEMFLVPIFGLKVLCLFCYNFYEIVSKMTFLHESLASLVLLSLSPVLSQRN